MFNEPAWWGVFIPIIVLLFNSLQSAWYRRQEVLYKYLGYPKITTANLKLESLENDDRKNYVLHNDKVLELQNPEVKKKLQGYLIVENISENPILEVKIDISYENSLLDVQKYQVFAINSGEKYFIPMSKLQYLNSYKGEKYIAAKRLEENKNTFITYKTLAGAKYNVEMSKEGSIYIYKEGFFRIKKIIGFKEKHNSRFEQLK